MRPAAEPAGAHLPFAMVVAWLEETYGYSRSEIRKLTRRYVNQVLGWPRTAEGKLRQPPSARGAAVSRADVLRDLLGQACYPAHMIESRVREILAQEEGRRGGRRKRGRRR